MTHHPNTPASRNDEAAFLIQICGEDIDHPLTAILPDWEAVRRFCIEHYVGSEDHTTYWGERTLDILKREFDEHEADERPGPYTEQWEIGGLSIQRVCDCTPPASRTEQAAPSVASGVADDAALLAWGERHRIGADVKRLRWAYEDAISLAAPGAAIAAREQESYVLFPNVDGTNNDTLYPERALASRQESPAASCVECGQTDQGQTGEYPCPTCGLPHVWDATPTAARSPATVAQPVVTYSDSASRLHVGDSAFEDWYQNYLPNSVGHKQIARDAYAAGMGDPLVIARDAAQPCPSQGCGGDGGEAYWQSIADRYYEHIKHGDDKHRAWLRAETDTFFAALSTDKGDGGSKE